VLDRLHQPVQHTTLGAAARQPRRAFPRRETSGHLHGTNAIPPVASALAAAASH